MKINRKNFSKYNVLFLFLFLFFLIFVSVYVFGLIELYNKPYMHTSIVFEKKLCQLVFNGNSGKICKDTEKKILKFEEVFSGNYVNFESQKSDGEWIKVDPVILSIFEKNRDVLKNALSVFGSFLGHDNSKTKGDFLDVLKNFDHNDRIVDKKNNYLKFKSAYSNILPLDFISSSSLCEEITKIYKKLNVFGAIVSFDNVTLVIGKKPRHEIWRISLKISEIKQDFVILEIMPNFSNVFISTFNIPKDDNTSGYDENISSVTIIYSDAVIAQILCKICSLIGPDKSINLLNYYGAEAIFTDRNKNLISTPKIINNLIILDEDYTKRALF
ncbi:MAG: FAD:protein FMN transferase [Candidatus Improbicoccus pseudotrichonymphae]|uniref:FAD:protein FMN transferase n=1 Tax=Candidatus Improbicoccus pseudotrichonymphae TaxID=3033792 RepID=A0AA48IGW2_9FIRM|nr:MAG: FAD:protein FMN transferase [Candidatus Improbicoccus pseudotrichonymphae]